MLHHSTAEGLVSYTRDSNAVKPSVSFMNLSRDQAKLKHFVDLQDGPSSLQKRDQVATLKEKSQAPLFYEDERKSHLSNAEKSIQTLKELRTSLFDKDPSRMSAIEA